MAEFSGLEGEKATKSAGKGRGSNHRNDERSLVSNEAHGKSSFLWTMERKNGKGQARSGPKKQKSAVGQSTPSPQAIQAFPFSEGEKKDGGGKRDGTNDGPAYLLKKKNWPGRSRPKTCLCSA